MMLRIRRNIVSTLLMVVSLFSVFAPTAVAAEGPNSALTAINTTIKNIFDKIQDAAQEAFLDAAAVLFNNGVQQFVNNLAAETAVWIASGDEGQKPLLFTDNWGDYLENAGENALASVAIEFAESAGLGNICVSPQVAIDIILPSLGQFGPTKPRCSLEDLKKTWDVRDPAFLENFTLSFQTNQNDLGVAVNFLAGAQEAQEAEEEAAKQERRDSVFKPVKDFISEAVKTPAPLVEKQIDEVSGRTVGIELDFTGRPVADAIRVFTATLAGQYLQKLQSGFFSLRDVAGEDEDARQRALNSLLDIAGTGPSGSQRATANVTNVFRPDLREASNYSLLQIMTQCPAEVKYSGIFNCAMDASFASALQASGEQGLLTVRDAVTKGYLHGDWAFGFTDPGAGIEPSYLNGYAYSNMKKLRRARMIPVGWELAALRARQLSKRVTLQEVLDGYNDIASPFFHLVDPNWVLKAPESRCTANVPGQIAQEAGPNRFDTCADIQDCVVTGADGQCQTWGYCTNEKRTWAFPGATCQAEFATCEQYIDKDGEGGDDNLWLAKTLDYRGCSAQSAGCTWYALAKNAVGEWREDDQIYLNRNAKECDAEDAGCRRYIRMVANTNLLRNASFEDDGGHNYVLGAGDSTANNGTPDGWSTRAVTASLDILDSAHGTNAVRLQAQSGSGVCAPALLYTAPIGSFEVGQQYTVSGQVRTDSPTPREVRLSFQGINFEVTDVGLSWKPFAFQFIMPATAASYTLALGVNDGDCASVNPATSIFYDAMQLEKGTRANSYRDYGSTNVVQLKAAPTCSFEDVGCLAYKADDDVSDTTINGVITGANLCPQQCVGYNTMEQQAVDVEPARFVNFIPSTARRCTAEQVGCQEYTNLDEVARGGEGLQYFSKIRHCEKPSSQCSTYYAWEGSQESGYQLMTYVIKASGANGTGAPLMTDNSTSCNPADTNCRELIGQDGTRYFRDITKTILCSDDCVPLRAGANTLNQTECVAKLGTWDAQSERCVFQVLPSESRSCPAQFNGCREYVGNTGKNVAVVLTDDFEDSDTSGWSAGAISTESTTVGGHSLRLGDTTGSVNATTQIAVNNVVLGKGYELEFSAKASVPDFLTVSVWLGNNKIDAHRLGGFITGTRSWNQYRVGPLVLPSSITTPAQLIVEVRGNSARGEVISLFIDNVELRQIKDSSFLVKNSWTTPAVCETNPPLPGGSAGRSMLGCRAYTVEGANGVTSKTYATGFTRLCSADKVGCEAVIDTFNSTPSYRQTFQEGDAAERVVPEDQVRFIVNRPEYECQSSAVGCMELGKPSFNSDGGVTGFESVYLINNPDQYTQTLCNGAGLFCKEFTTSAGSVVYAKHPKAQQCEYLEVPGSFPPRYAWYKVGDTEENPAECLDAERNEYALRCPAEEISCNEWVEPITQESFYYRTNTLRSNNGECNGIVDWKNGCVLFEDRSNPNMTFKSGTEVDVVGAPEPCQTNDVGCNTNVLMKVNLDRVCSQWLTGLSTSRFWDRNLQQFRVTSYGLGRCIEADPLNPNICRTWDNNPDKPLLTIDSYRARDVSWAGEDYSGYSIPNVYPAETLRQRSVGIDEDGNPTGFRLTRLENEGQTCTSTTAPAGQGGCPVGQVCRQSLNVETGAFEGRCYVETGLDGTGTSSPAFCRGYPEEDSPFPAKLAQFGAVTDEKNPGQIISKDPLFKNANIGQNGEDVECSYHKAYYGTSSAQAKYYGINSIPANQIRVDGEDHVFTRKDTFIGWTGYCLEYDTSRIINGSQDEYACLTWYPVDVINGALDFNNTSLKSGYIVPNDRESYCAESSFAEYRRNFVSCEENCPSGYILERRAESSTCSNGRRRRFCAPVQGEGWYVHDGALDGYEAQYGIQQMCTKVARIASADGKNRAWTSSILGEALPGTKVFFVDELGWGPQQQNQPYGAARTLVSRLEDLPQPLLVRDPNTFVDNCKECKFEDGDPFGICQDNVPERKGRLCPLGPNAGSPYALLSESNPALINDTNVKVRRDNKLPADEAQPYPGSENYEKGFDRLQDLFARSYGVYQWQSLQNICVGVCQGGLSDGEACETNTACGDPDTTISYSCVGDPFGRTTGTCIGGFKDSNTCSADADCQAPRTGTIHQCVPLTGTDQDPNNPQFACQSGPFVGRICSTIADCDENTADGVCSFERRCQATDATGNVIVSVNSGKLCSTTSECNAVGTCRVDRCSTETPGTNSGVCSGKNAGDSCGTSSNVSGYARIPANNGAVGWDLVLESPQLAQLPIVRPTVADATSPSGFEEGSITGFSVNGSTGGALAFNNGRAPVTVSFYAYNDNGEQMPLRVLMVDWGDGSDPAESRGAFPNRKHLCRKFCSNAVGVACTFDQECQNDAVPNATCQPFNFGDSDDACIGDSGSNNGYFTFSYTYTCDSVAPCTFTPKVMVRDNWGATTRITFPGSITVNPEPAQ